MPHYTPRPLPVFAMQYTGDNKDEIKENFKNVFDAPFSKKELTIWYANKRLTSQAFPTDYILRDHAGNISVMSKEEFEERYVEGDPSDWVHIDDIKI